MRLGRGQYNQPSLHRLASDSQPATLCGRAYRAEPGRPRGCPPERGPQEHPQGPLSRQCRLDGHVLEGAWPQKGPPPQDGHQDSRGRGVSEYCQVVRRARLALPTPATARCGMRARSRYCTSCGLIHSKHRANAHSNGRRRSPPVSPIAGPSGVEGLVCGCHHAWRDDGRSI